MDKVIALAQDMVGALKESETYQAYLNMKQKVEEIPELKNKIVAYKKAGLEYELKLLQDEQPTFADEQHVSNLYSEIMFFQEDGKKDSNSGMEYLEMENRLLQVIGQIYQMIDNEIKL